MFATNDKRRIYWLIDQYLKDKIDAWTFATEYHECYDLEVDLNTLNSQEAKVFSELSNIAGRFTDIEEDLVQYPEVYYTEEELREQILKTKNALLKDWLDV